MTDEAHEDVVDELDALWDQPSSAAFRNVLARLEVLAQSGSIDAAESLAEARAQLGPNRDASAAYRWYFIALSQRGYSTTFSDQNGTPPFYCGPDGDFRNEAPVSDLISELGFDRARQLDAEALDWLKSRGISVS